jgi:hypothetical protein
VSALFPVAVGAAVALWAAAPAPPPIAPDGTLAGETDPGANQATLEARLEPLSKNGVYWTHASLTIEVVRGRHSRITVRGSVESQHYQSCGGLSLSVAGEKLALGAPRRSSAERHMASADVEMPSYSVFHTTVERNISFEDLRQIGRARAGQVTGRICWADFTLRPEQMTAIRTLIQKL